MKKELKIIHILCDQPNQIIFKYKNPEDCIKDYGFMEYIKIDNYPHWIGFFEDDFHAMMAYNTLKRTDKYKIECWRPYGRIIDKIYSKNVNGVLHRVFPSKSIRIPKIDYFEWSRPILDELKREISRNKTLIHIHDGHTNFIIWLILKLKKMNVPIIYQHRGGWFSIFHYKRTKKLKYLYKHYRQLKTLRSISHYFSNTFERDFLQKKIGFQNSSVFMDGEDFNFFKPGNKEIVRRKLGLPIDKKIILYVGHFSRLKGAHLLIKAFERLKARGEKITLLLVGGYKENEFYQMGKDAGAIMVERVPKDKLKLYYQAADIYAMLITNDLLIRFAGFGAAPIQALASGLPLLSNNIIHFPGTREERDKIGMTMESEEKLEQNILFMLNNLAKFKECRAIAKKYYDINFTMKLLLDKYNELFEKYYDKNQMHLMN